tara:strand:+ start:1694 stop:1837 length:144 start_codon:yes stop_codon:yes gene_type:complete
MNAKFDMPNRVRARVKLTPDIKAEKAYTKEVPWQKNLRQTLVLRSYA